MRRDPYCGCPIESDMTLHGYDDPCIAQQQQQQEHDWNAKCADDGHPYHGDDGERGRCWCGHTTYPTGGPDAA